MLSRLELVIDRLIQKENISYFYVGEYGSFDRLAAASVKRLKKSIRTSP